MIIIRRPVFEYTAHYLLWGIAGAAIVVWSKAPVISLWLAAFLFLLWWLALAALEIRIEKKPQTPEDRDAFMLGHWDDEILWKSDD